MKKKKIVSSVSAELFADTSKAIEVDLSNEMRKSFLDYSMSVIVMRALPDVRDGLKPVHRRILYTMYENTLYPDKPYRKCADTVGSVLGRYHPHGDASVYDALVRLAQNFSLRYPLVDGHGNFGSVDGDPPAAYRYTESRMGKIAMHMLTDIDSETVDFMPNYDDRLQEPTVLPSRFPNLLVNGSTGIAVGMATNIPPHNLTEVIDAVCLLIDNPDSELDDIMQFIQGPDFPTGALIMGKSGIRAAYGTGRGKITMRSRAEIEEDEKKGRQRIVVTEIPYMVNKARLIESIAGLVKDKRVEGIADINDESGREGIRIVIDVKRDANAQVVLNQLYKLSQLQETFGVINLALVNGVPKVLTLKEMLNCYIDHQYDVITRRCEFELKKARERAHILEGLKIALDFIDEVIAILRKSPSINDGKVALMDRFGLDDLQANAIVQMRLGQLTGLEKQKIEEELLALNVKIGELIDILSDKAKVLNIVKEEITALKDKFGDERRTEIMAIDGEMDIEDLIAEEECVITMTHFGYIKRMAVSEYRAQRRGGRGISGMNRREEDFAEEIFICSTHDYVAFFSDKGRVYRLKGYEIAESSRTARGTNIINLLPLEQGEKITAMVKFPSLSEEEQYLVMVTKNGVIKRTRLSEYKNIRKSGLIAITLDEGDELRWVNLTNGEDDVLIATKKGMAIRIDENQARPLGRSARGVRAINLRDGDEVVGVAKFEEGASILTISENGKGRRTENDAYRRQNRGGYGSTNYKVDEKKGLVAGVKSVHDGDDIIIISNDGIIIRTNVDDINSYSKYGSGVNVMRLGEGAKIVTFAVTPKEEDVEEKAAQLAQENAQTAEDLMGEVKEKGDVITQTLTPPTEETPKDIPEMIEE